MEIDESMFGHKRKYNRGRVSEGAWVFGMVERGSGRALTVCVPGRVRETLVTPVSYTHLTLPTNREV